MGGEWYRGTWTGAYLLLRNRACISVPLGSRCRIIFRKENKIFTKPLGCFLPKFAPRHYKTHVTYFLFSYPGRISIRDVHNETMPF